MYNQFQASKIREQLKKQRKKQLINQHWLQKYQSQVQPKLIENYSKRISNFVRKMEQKPVLLKSFDEMEFAPHRLFRNVNKEAFLGDQCFHFKDHNDWSSIYTEAERTQRKQNQKIMQQKFGDSTLAYRSIVSQSQYQPSSKHEFRIRLKAKQINPPMRYTYKASKAEFNRLKKKLSNKRIKTLENNKKQQQQLQLRHRTTTKHSLLQDDARSVHSFRSMNSIQTTITSKMQNMEDQQKKKEKQKQQYMSPKLHFKRVVDLYENTDDIKLKNSLKQVLVKCGVFKNKDRRMITQVQLDRLSSELEGSIINGNALTNPNTKQIKQIKGK